MKAITLLGFLLTYLTLNVHCQDMASEEDSLMSKIINWRHEKNLNLGNNQLIRTLDELSINECYNLLHNPEQMGKNETFPAIVKSENLGNGEYIAQFFAKSVPSVDHPSAIFQLWTKDANIAKHLSYEYNQYGINCQIYGIERICVMHLKKVATKKYSTVIR